MAFLGFPKWRLCFQATTPIFSPRLLNESLAVRLCSTQSQAKGITLCHRIDEVRLRGEVSCGQLKNAVVVETNQKSHPRPLQLRDNGHTAKHGKRIEFFSTEEIIHTCSYDLQ
jgi:hypothetical protein